MSYTTPWPRVYPNISSQHPSTVKRLTIEVPVSDAAVILAAACNPAVFSLICQTAIQKTAQYVRTNAITYADSQRLLDYICQRPDSQSPRETPAHDDAGRVESVHSGAENVAKESPSTRSETPTGSGGKGNKVDRNEKIRAGLRRAQAKSGRHDEGNGDVTT